MRIPCSYRCLEVGLYGPKNLPMRCGNRLPAPPLSTLIISPPPLYSATRLVAGLHGSPEDIRRRIRRSLGWRDPAWLPRPRRRHPGDDEDGADFLDPLREREGGFEGPLHHARGEPGGPPGRDDGPRHGRPR